MNSLSVIDRGGPEKYEDTLLFQNELVEARVNNRSLSDVLVLVEHQEVYTVGRGVEVDFEALKSIPCFEVKRGGKATFHGPGQLVAYPIFDLTQHGQDVHVFIRKLEKSVIHCLEVFSVQGKQQEGETGVWVELPSGEEKKIASLGIGVRRWVSFHGIALNVKTDLRYFRTIRPCDMDSEVMTSLEEICGIYGHKVPSMGEVKAALILAVEKEFGFIV